MALYDHHRQAPPIRERYSGHNTPVTVSLLHLAWAIAILFAGGSCAPGDMTQIDPPSYKLDTGGETITKPSVLDFCDHRIVVSSLGSTTAGTGQPGSWSARPASSRLTADTVIHLAQFPGGTGRWHWTPQAPYSHLVSDLPSASQLQWAHNLGKNMAANHFEQESFGFGPPPKDLMRHRLDDYLKEQGSRLSDAEKEVFTEAYWSEYGKQMENYGGYTPQIHHQSSGGDMPQNLRGASPTTKVFGKTATPGPGTLQLTDAEGNSHFANVDANGNYSITIPQWNFQPTKMTLRTRTVKAAWELQDGTWRQISGVTTGTTTPATTPTQGAIAPNKAPPRSSNRPARELNSSLPARAVLLYYARRDHPQLKRRR